MNAFISGFSLGFSLILAIGAQNAFVLKQGIKKEHVFVICLICALSNAVLIFALYAAINFSLSPPIGKTFPDLQQYIARAFHMYSSSLFPPLHYKIFAPFTYIDVERSKKVWFIQIFFCIF